VVQAAATWPRCRAGEDAVSRLSRGRLAAACIGIVTLGLSSVMAARTAAAVPRAAAPISFGKSTLAGQTSTKPTTLQFGPDGRLYVLQQDGTIKIYTVVRNGRNSYSVTATETVTLVRDIPNHNDDGTLNTTLTTRQATGMVVTGTAARPVLYVTSSDPRFGGGPRGNLNIDTNSGIVSRLTWDGSTWSKLDLVVGLPRSEEDHAVNGVAMNAAGTVLYVAVGGNTNMGAPSHVFADLPEYALGAAILTVDLSAIGDTTYDLPTLDPADHPNSPFGGDFGANQAVIVAGGPVQLYATGFRNPYDILISSKGVMYTDDNGPNAHQGNVPIDNGPQGTCTNGINEPGVTHEDSLHVVTPGYYGGHPNPTRGNAANTFNGRSPIVAADPIECDYELQGTAAHPVLATDPSSSNGIAEYTASNFGGAMKGDLLLAAYDNYVERIQVDSTGTVNLGKTTLFSNVGVNPLDIVAMGDNDAFPGTIWVADHGNSAIYVFEPSDFGGGGPTAQPDETIKLAGDASALGRNLVNTTGVGQTRTVTTARGVSRTFVVKVWNNGTSADSFLLASPGSTNGFTVTYLKGASGSTNITTAVVAGTYATASLAPGNGAVIRVVVTIAANAPSGVTRDWLVVATSQQDSSAHDGVDARLKTK
jgi:Glucose / Sorbosone dehydrogenase